MEPIDNTSIPNIKSILLLGANNMVALPVIRSIGKKMPHVKIHTLSYRKDQHMVPGHSRYVYARHYIEPTNEESLFNILKQKIKQTGANILLPIDEQDVKRVSSLKDKLRKYVHLPPLPSTKLFDSLVNKNQLINLLKKHHLPYATTFDLSSSSVADIDPSVFPALLKPIRGSSGTGIKKAKNRENLDIILEGLNSRNYILQEYIPGQKIICNLLAKDGNIQAMNIQEGLESRNYSFSTAIKFIENESVSKLTHQLIHETNYSGLANIDFQLDERDGQAKLIDFNPRFWSSLSGSKAAGVDFTLLTCLAALGEPLNDFINRSTLSGNIYHMGRSTFKYYYKRTTQPSSDFKSINVNTDFMERFTDPLPEIYRLLP